MKPDFVILSELLDLHKTLLWKFKVSKWTNGMENGLLEKMVENKLTPDKMLEIQTKKPGKAPPLKYSLYFF